MLGETGNTVGAAEGEKPPSADEVREQLERVIASPEFSASERDRKFLRYVVEETLAGRADRIKGYSIGTEVFGRDASFDAQSDPVVRIEAGRLRRALERYYLMDGRADPIRIDIPKGAYVPTFTRRTGPSVEAPATSEAPLGPIGRGSEPERGPSKSA